METTGLNSAAPKGRIRLFLCGGGATNIGKIFEADRNTSRIGFGDIEAVYVDTSASNLDDSIPRDSVYLLKNVDGSGKIRKENANEIANVVKDVLQQFPPLDFNIVISTTTGGSGSVIAPMLTRELLSKGARTVVGGVGSASDKLEIENNLKTLKSYDAIARSVGIPVVMFYSKSGKGFKRAEVDAQIQEMVGGLAVLFSRQNRGIDTRDLNNWQNYPIATSYEAKLVSLHMVDDDEQFKGLGNVITVASLTKEGEEVHLPLVPDYCVHGFSGVEAVQRAPVHFVVAEGHLLEEAEGAEKHLQELTEQQNARVKAKGISDGNDQTGVGGLVF